MKNFVTLLTIAFCLGAFSFTYLKEPNMDKKFIHTVYFWLDQDLTPAEITEFTTALQTLGTIPTVDKFYWGPPAPTEKREVIDNTYDYAINVHFSSIQAHDTYQEHEIHLEFLKHADKWKSVKVFDNLIK